MPPAAGKLHSFMRASANVAGAGVLAFALILMLPLPALAQPRVQSAQVSILLIDSEAAYAGSELGRRMAAKLKVESRKLASENRTIETELIDEEKQLTEQRKTLPPDEFRALADAFDEKVRRIRIEQDNKARAIGQQGEDGRSDFLTAARPILQEIMRETGSVAILEIRTVFFADKTVDITQEVIRRLDAVTPPDTTQNDPAPKE